ncbi:MAG: MBL fold metallo-hydrolase [Magnetococcales bacterium]|nr:MBL fold metallo-hydrolase [Magnetococcales bacterium]
MILCVLRTLMDVDDRIVLIDTHYQQRWGHTASYLINEPEGAAFVETGTTHAASLLLAALAQRQVAREAVQYVIVTHIHLDHAGGAGELLHHLPNAKLVVHPRGARHMIDPQRLINSSRQVYGEAFDRIYGTIHPVAENRLIIADDTTEITVGRRRLRFIATEGHAKHHFCVWDPDHHGLFSGDALGISFREFDVGEHSLIFPATTPTQFDPEVACLAIERLAQLQPRWIYLTHFGPLPWRPQWAETLQQGVRYFASWAYRGVPLADTMSQWLLETAQSFGCQLPPSQMRALLSLDIELNVQGLSHWAASKNPSS